MAANVRVREFDGQVQNTGSAALPANVRVRGFVGTITSGAPPVTAAAWVRVRGFSGTILTGTPVTPTPANVRMRGFSGKVLPSGTPSPGQTRTGIWTKRGGVMVPVRVYSAAQVHAIQAAAGL